MPNSLWLSPHSDDSVLFGAYTLLREKPLVLTVTDSFIQSNRGENITWEQRREEDIAAMKILGCSIIFGGIRDDVLDAWSVKRLLNNFYNFDTVYAPAVQGGNKDHDLIGKLAKEMFKDNCIQYTTYTSTDLYTIGKTKVFGIPQMQKLKEKALLCYQSQINLLATKPHFDAMKGKDEWYM